MDAYILVAANGLVDVAGRELVQLLVVAKDDDGHVDGAEDRQLVGLFEEAALALEKGAGGRVSWWRAGGRAGRRRVLTPSGSGRL